MMDDETTQRLHDYLDGVLEDAEQIVLESQLANDSALRDELESLRQLRAQAKALPRHIEPGRDLWPEIASRLDRAGRKTIDFRGYRTRTRMRVARYLVAAAALVLFAVSTPYLLAPQSGDETPQRAGGVEDTVLDDPEYKRVAAQYVSARDELLALLQERKSEIAPETFAVVEENLTVIASAVSEIETALATQPQSDKLERMLYAAYRSEVNLLRQAVQLSDAPEASNPADAEGGDNNAG